MVLVNFANIKAGTAASFGIYAIAVSLGPTSIIDSIRTTLWHQSVFGSAYALKVTMNNAYAIPRSFSLPLRPTVTDEAKQHEHNHTHYNRRSPRR